MTAPKLCRDCKWVDANGRPEIGEFAVCARVKGRPKVNLVTGIETRRYRGALYCATHRNEGWLSARLDGLCGTEGRWFEPREPAVVVYASGIIVAQGTDVIIGCEPRQGEGK